MFKSTNESSPWNSHFPRTRHSTNREAPLHHEPRPGQLDLIAVPKWPALAHDWSRQGAIRNELAKLASGHAKLAHDLVIGHARVAWRVERPSTLTHRACLR